MSRSHSAPPRWAERLFSWCLPHDALGTSIAGDVRHEYINRRRQTPRWRAFLWYMTQVVGVGGWYLTRRALGRYTRRGESRQASSQRMEIGMNGMLHDVRLAVRSLSRSPMFALTAIGTITLGIGATTAVYSVLHGVLFTPLSLPDDDRLVTLWGDDQDFGRVPLPAPDFRDIRNQATALTDLAARWTQSQSLRIDDGAEEVMTAYVTTNYFSTLGVRPLLGRSFMADDQNVAVLSYGSWVRLFGSDASIVGRNIDIGGRPREVIGVLPPGLNPNMTTISRGREQNDVWLVFSDSWLDGDDRVTAWIRSVGRLAPNATIEQARQELDAIHDRIAEFVPERRDGNFRFVLYAARDDLVGGVRELLLVLFTAVGFVLLIACFNVANLLLVRGQIRTREIALRVALGAGRFRLMRQLFAENAVVATIGGTLGVAFATLGIDVLHTVRPANLPRIEAVTLSVPVVLFALTATALSTLIFGLVPVLRTANVSPDRSLGRARDSSAPKQRRASRILIVSEVALSLSLLVGCGLMLRTFSELRRIQPGFDPKNALTMSITSSGRQNDSEETAVFYRQLYDAIATLPGVTFVGAANRLPLAGGIYGGPWATSAAAIAEGDNPEADFRFVSADFFGAMGTHLIAGRLFEPNDGDDVVLINERMAAIAFPGTNPVGQILWTGELGRNGEATRVIGVVEDIRHTGLGDDGKETVYFHDTATSLFPGVQRYVVVRSDGDPSVLTASIRTNLRTLDPGATISRVRTMESLVGDALAPTQFAMLLIGLFAGSAVLLAAVGLYGLIAYSVSQRSREIGIRIALGARRGDIFRRVIREGLGLMVFGLVVGVGVALGLTASMQSLLYGVSSTDAVTFATVAALLGGVGILATYAPARRAMAVDPIVALRSE